MAGVGVDVGADRTTDRTTDPTTSGGEQEGAERAPVGRHGLRELGPVLLLRSAHPRTALLTALGVALVAALAGRPLREVLLVLSTVLVGQAVVGWHHDLVDRRRPSAAEPGGSPRAWPPHPPYETNAGSSAYDAAAGTHDSQLRRSTRLPSRRRAQESR